MAARTHIVDGGGAARKLKRWGLVDSGGVTRMAKRVFMIDAGGVARQIFTGEIVLLETNMVAGVGNSEVTGNAVGYIVFFAGSMDAANLPDGGYPVFAVADSAFYGTLAVAIYDFGSDPGAAFLTHVEVDGVVQEAAGYSYDNTVATWTFPVEAGFQDGLSYAIRLLRRT